MRRREAIATMAGALVGVGAGMAAPRGARADAGGVVDERLANGMRVVLVPDRRLPIVGMALRYAVGSRDDAGGLGLLTPRLMVQASKHFGRGEAVHLLDAAGARDFVGWDVQLDATTTQVTLPSHRANLALWLWSDVMGFFAERVDDALVTEVARLLAEERLRRVDDAPYGALEGLVRAELYPEKHPYRTAPRGWPEGRTPTAAEVRDFFVRSYTPSRAALAIVGDFDVAAMRAEVRRYFEPIPARPAIAIGAPKEGIERDVRLDVAANVDQPMVAIDWLLAGHAVAEPATEALAAICYSSNLRALEWKLRPRAGRATATYARRDLGSTFRVQAWLAPGTTPESVVASVDELVGEHVADTVTPALVEQAKNWLSLTARAGLERAVDRAHAWTERPEGTGAPSSEIWRDLKVDDVRAAARRLRASHGTRRIVTSFEVDRAAPIAGVLRDRRPS